MSDEKEMSGKDVIGCYLNLKHDYDGVDCGNLIETWIRALSHVDPFGMKSIWLYACMHCFPHSSALLVPK